MDRYNPPKNIVRNLTSVNDDNLRSAIAELQVAAALGCLGYDIDMRRQFGRSGLTPLTPDIFASKGDLRLIVEVLTKKNDLATETLRDLLDGLATELEGRLSLPADGFLSLSVIPSAATDMNGQPGPALLDLLAADLNRWLGADPYSTTYRNLQGPLPMSGSLMPGDRAQVVITPPGGALGQSPRISDAVSGKIKKYAALTTPDTHLTIAVVAGGWKVTENQVVTALFGTEQLLLDGSGDVVGAQYDGRGSAVAGGPFDDGGADKLAGVWFLERVGHYQDSPPELAMRLSFLHSPYAQLPIDPQHIGAARQLVPKGNSLDWLRGDPLVMLR